MYIFVDFQTHTVHIHFVCNTKYGFLEREKKTIIGLIYVKSELSLRHCKLFSNVSD